MLLLSSAGWRDLFSPEGGIVTLEAARKDFQTLRSHKEPGGPSRWRVTLVGGCVKISWRPRITAHEADFVTPASGVCC